MSGPPLVILGIDAGDPHFIEQWSAQGYLPHLASLMERGCWARTTSHELISEHGVWISLFSGRSRSQHGYYYYRQLKPDSYDLQEVTGAHIEAAPFWTRFKNSNHHHFIIIDPPDENICEGLPGIQLVNWSTHNNWNPMHYACDARPEGWMEKIEGQFGPKQITLENHNSVYEEDLVLYEKLLSRVANKGSLCRHLFQQKASDLYVAVFAETHAANHQFWKYCPEVAANQNRPETRLTHAIRDIYQALDIEIGRVVEVLPPEANIVVVSSVGMADDYPFTGISEQFFRQLGYQVAPQPRPSFNPMSIARSILPESWRIAMSRHLSRERREKLLAEQFKNGTDWSQTRAFALPSAYTTFVRINLEGREPLGIVKRGHEYDQLLQEIERDLFELIDPVTGACPVERVVRTVEAFGGGPPSVLPDMFIEWKEGRFVSEVVHPKATITQKRPDFYRRSDHSSHGFFVAAGPDIPAEGRREEVEVLDLAPTFLTLMGEPVPEEMVGSSFLN